MLPQRPQILTLLNFKVYMPLKRLARQQVWPMGKARDMRDLASEKADQMAANIKASDSRETLAGPMEYGRGEIEGACDQVNQKWNIVKDKVLDGADNIEDTMGGALGYEKIN
ncbi:hypothetical protein OIU76_024427 [Salix suchowensis]|nr:hypothetical protein OIU76_024427 [Salix suchowensis]